MKNDSVIRKYDSVIRKKITADKTLDIIYVYIYTDLCGEYYYVPK